MSFLIDAPSYQLSRRASTEVTHERTTANPKHGETGMHPFESMNLKCFLETASSGGKERMADREEHRESVLNSFPHYKTTITRSQITSRRPGSDFCSR